MGNDKRKPYFHRCNEVAIHERNISERVARESFPTGGSINEKNNLNRKYNILLLLLCRVFVVNYFSSLFIYFLFIFCPSAASFVVNNNNNRIVVTITKKMLRKQIPIKNSTFVKPLAKR